LARSEVRAEFNSTIFEILREELMRESPIYQEIIREGVQRGKQDTLIRQLTRRIGTVPPQLQAQVQSLSIEQLDELSEALFDFASAADLTAWLQQEPRRQS
jgi:predicted transposase YdaD